jgi:hypothetical protein
MGMLPTGNRVEIPAMDMARICEDKIVEMKIMPNMLSLLQPISGVPVLGDRRQPPPADRGRRRARAAKIQRFPKYAIHW